MLPIPTVWYYPEPTKIKLSMFRLSLHASWSLNDGTVHKSVITDFIEFYNRLDPSKQADWTLRFFKPSDDQITDSKPLSLDFIQAFISWFVSLWFRIIRPPWAGSSPSPCIQLDVAHCLLNFSHVSYCVQFLFLFHANSILSRKGLFNFCKHKFG